jgi:hypothetical protein
VASAGAQARPIPLAAGKHHARAGRCRHPPRDAPLAQARVAMKYFNDEDPNNALGAPWILWVTVVATLIDTADNVISILKI